ncbi:MAG: glutathione S-transferase C-terminal domain-containing protein [Hyphomicrobiales bacterium]
MITLYTFGPAFGLPDPSPFVTKAHMLLRIAGIDYDADTNGYNKAPRGKQPYIDDDGTLISDSTLIRLHLEYTHGIDFDKGYAERDLAAAWAVEKMLEEHVYFHVMAQRWSDDGNFERGPSVFFNAALAMIRPLVKWKIRKNVMKTLHNQGAGRFAPEELGVFSTKAFEAISRVMGDNKYLLGDHPCGADATVYAFVAAAAAPLFPHPVHDAVIQFDNLIAYAKRMDQEFFPELYADQPD